MSEKQLLHEINSSREVTKEFTIMPEDIWDRGWDGATEVREMNPDQLIDVFEYFHDQLEELGVWRFADNYVPMTKEQQEECKRRAAEEANG